MVNASATLKVPAPHPENSKNAPCPLCDRDRQSCAGGAMGAPTGWAACGRSAGRPPHPVSLSLFAQMLERDADALVIQLLEVGTELVAAARAAMEELRHSAERGVGLALDLGRAAEI